MSRSLMWNVRLPVVLFSAAAMSLIAVSGGEAHAQYGVDTGYYDGAYYDDDFYDDDWYYDYYDGRTGSYLDDREEYEYEPDEGYHEEEWYDPSDWFDNDPGIDYEDGDYYDDAYDYDGYGYDDFYEDDF